MDIVKVLSNPIRMQVMQYLQTYGEATTKQISESLKDIPTPTLYRHINVMVKEEVLLIKEERKVRGSLERLLTINYEKMSSPLHSNYEYYRRNRQKSRNRIAKTITRAMG